MHGNLTPTCSHARFDLLTIVNAASLCCRTKATITSVVILSTSYFDSSSLRICADLKSIHAWE